MKRRGFTLIELLIVVAIIGVIAAIAVPNLLNAVQRAKQKRTMADIRSLGLALESYAVDTGFFPSAGSQEAVSNLLNGSGLTASTIMGKVVPTYIKGAVNTDGWNNPMRCAFNYDYQSFAIGSWGRSGIQDSSYTQGVTTDFNADIIYSDGAFTKYPEGVQN